MRRFFGLYQYLGPLILFPVSYWLWWSRYDHDHRLVVLVLSMPIVFSYVIPGIGTNVLGLWEFHTRLRLGRFRPHHGFVFGSATSLLAFVCVDGRPCGFDVWQLVRAGFLMGSVLAFWNWLYDVYAIKSGLITVYNRPFGLNQGPEAIATDYAPVLFGSFGFCYGVAIQVCQYCLREQGQWQLLYGLAALCNLAVVLLPVGAFVLSSYLRTGTTGLKPFRGGTNHE